MKRPGAIVSAAVIVADIIAISPVILSATITLIDTGDCENGARGGSDSQHHLLPLFVESVALLNIRIIPSATLRQTMGRRNQYIAQAVSPTAPNMYAFSFGRFMYQF